ncbi:MAG: hypothetical protein WA071_13870, partial [Undibacterium umbellatum]|uniref:hypothetical protein n=1 Tax=Undibacterium umbellatum TaxID=2762300 RepID=UPI003BB76A57
MSKPFLQRLIDDNTRRFETRNAEIVRMIGEIEGAESIIQRIEAMLGNQLRLDLRLEDPIFYPHPLHIGENFSHPYSTRLHDVLVTLGFEEVYRMGAKPSLYDHVVMKKSDMLLSIDTRTGYRLPALRCINLQR